MSTSTAVKRIAIVSASGGVGKTTLALVLAYHLLNRFRDKVLLMDLDPTAGLSLRLLGEDLYERFIIKEKRTLSRLIRDREEEKNEPLDNYLVDLFHITEESFIDVYRRGKLLSAGEEIIHVFTEWASKGWGVDKLWGYLKEGLEDFEFVIADTAPFFDPRYAMAAVANADMVLVPLRPSIVDVRRTLRMLGELKKLEARPRDVRFIFNFDEAKYEAEYKLLREKFGIVMRSTKGKEKGPRGSRGVRAMHELEALLMRLKKEGDFVLEALNVTRSLSEEELPYTLGSKGKAQVVNELERVTCGLVQKILSAVGVDLGCPMYEIETIQ